MLWAVAVLAVALTALTAHAALVGGPMGDHVMSDAAAICAVVGGTLAVTGVAVGAVRLLIQRRPWTDPLPLAAARVLLPSACGLPVRAGPPLPALLQVFRF